MPVRFARKLTVVSLVLILIGSVLPVLCADEPNADLKHLGDEVDVLQIIADMGFSKEQVTQLVARVSQITAKRREYASKEQAILERIKAPLQQMKDALIDGKPVTDTAKTLADSGLKELEALRKQSWSDYDVYVLSATKLFSARQIRDIRRSPAARKRAGEIVQDIRFSPENKYVQIRDKFVDELVEVKKADRAEEWLKIGQEKLSGTTGDARAQAVKELQEIKDKDIAEMKAEASGLLDSIRPADSRILSVGVDRLASALRSDTEVNAELASIMARILDSPTAESVLKMRAERMKDTPASEE
jgi:hypothetical protein